MIKNRRKSKILNNKRLLIVNVFLLLFLFIGIGYSVLSTNLNVTGDVTVKEYKQPTLYNVLRNAAEVGTYAQEYTRNYQDSINGDGDQKIYYWSASTTSDAEEISNMNNVVFANYCWQMVRTTDTGGVKLLYNGEPENNQCLDTRGNHLGYNGTVYSNEMSDTYWYGTGYTQLSSQSFKISGTLEQTVWNKQNSKNLVGKYTCFSANPDEACSSIKIVESYKSDTEAKYIRLSEGSHYSQLGTLPFNSSYYELTKVGYMINNDYSINTEKIPQTENYKINEMLLRNYYSNVNYWYADSVVYSNGKYSLVNPYTLGSSSNLPNQVGKYTFASSDQSTTSESVYYVAAVTSTNVYYATLTNNVLIPENINMLFADSYTKISDNNYVLNDPVSVSLTDWFNDYSNYVNKYTCNNNSTNCSNPRLITNASKDSYYYLDIANKILIAKSRNGLILSDTLVVSKYDLFNDYSSYSTYKYTCNNTSSTCTEANLRYIVSFSSYYYKYVPNRYYGTSVTWDGTNYTLQDTIDVENYKNKTAISNHHYICLDFGKKTCSKIAYIFYLNSTNSYDDIQYVIIDDGVTSISTILNTMLSSNSDSSTIKVGVDAFYSNSLLEYDDYIDDVIYCENRRVNRYAGWDENGGDVTSYLNFGTGISGVMSCSNITDRFSVSNNQAKLTYKIGILSGEEAKLLERVIKSGEYFWVAKPSSYFSRSGYLYPQANGYYSNQAGIIVSYTDSDPTTNGYSSKLGVRPVITLIENVKYVSGTGTKNDPYIVE